MVLMNNCSILIKHNHASPQTILVQAVSTDAVFWASITKTLWFGIWYDSLASSFKIIGAVSSECFSVLISLLTCG